MKKSAAVWCGRCCGSEALREELRIICEAVRRRNGRKRPQPESETYPEKMGCLTKKIVEQMTEAVYVYVEFEIVWK